MEPARRPLLMKLQVPLFDLSSRGRCWLEPTPGLVGAKGELGCCGCADVHHRPAGKAEAASSSMRWQRALAPRAAQVVARRHAALQVDRSAGDLGTQSRELPGIGLNGIKLRTEILGVPTVSPLRNHPSVPRGAMKLETLRRCPGTSHRVEGQSVWRGRRGRGAVINQHPSKQWRSHTIAQVVLYPRSRA